VIFTQNKHKKIVVVARINSLQGGNK